jgi:ATP-dependent DNA helicase RecG
LPNAFAPDVIEANERSYEQRLSSCRMVASADTLCPLFSAYLFGYFSKDLINGAYIQFLRIAGTEMTDQILDDALIDGPIGQMLRRVEESLNS